MPLCRFLASFLNQFYPFLPPGNTFPLSRWPCARSNLVSWQHCKSHSRPCFAINSNWQRNCSPVEAHWTASQPSPTQFSFSSRSFRSIHTKPVNFPFIPRCQFQTTRINISFQLLWDLLFFCLSSLMIIIFVFERWLPGIQQKKKNLQSFLSSPGVNFASIISLSIALREAGNPALE